MRPSLLSACVLPALLIACGSEDADTDPFIPDLILATGDTAPPPPDLKLVDEVRFVAFIAWDPVLGEVVTPATIDGDEGFISAFVISLYEKDWDASDDSTFCKVAIDLDGIPLTDAALDEPLIWGIDVTDGENRAYETCLDKGFDVSSFIGGDPIATWANYVYSIAAGGDPDTELVEWLTPETPTTDFDINIYSAATFAVEPADFSSDATNNFFYGYFMDDAYNIDRSITHDKATILGVDGLVQGYYVWDQRVFWGGLSELE